ncbi:hypothetical protein E2C01_038020 [Portunus trituberculatus]|uniref:Uncharacterized protein n=1 Tax=Portunus trituberculatus TaxID=210409 RepID=A0A5B7FHE8_PORTR|nr:hypothetical protein [Portunus trituberculatus]
MSFVHHDIIFITGWAFLAIWANLDPRLHSLQPLQEGKFEEVFILLPYDLLLTSSSGDVMSLSIKSMGLTSAVEDALRPHDPGGRFAERVF